MSDFISGVAQVAGTVGGIGQAARSVGALSSDLGNLLSGDLSAIGPQNDLGPWAQGLRPASWRGIRFAVRESDVHRGRRTAVHEYPFRDTVWVEDLGRSARRYGFRGFLVGSDVYTRRNAMLAASEVAGPGTLVHPSLGSLQVSLVDFSCGESAEAGGVVELQFGFIEGGAQLYPTQLVSTKGVVGAAADAANSATSSDFLSNVTGAISHGAQVVQGVVSTVQGWASVAGRLASDASIASHAVTGLIGNFGRYSGGGRQATQAGISTVTQALSSVTTARTALNSAASAASSLASAL